ncbi:MAG: hypothetical protein JWO19_3952 [Bryobacterales bacterium]|nr:hypothetical protein [Bryobacterales bacterium]
MNLAHVHLLLNHFPTIGTIIGLGLFLVGLAAKSDDLKRASLVVFLGIALLTIPTYMSGNAAQEMICKSPNKTVCTDPGVSRALIEKHEGSALLAFAFMEVTGAFAWLGLWQYRRIARLPRWSLAAVALFSVITFGLMAQAANIGGEIRHPEIMTAQEAEAAQAAGEQPLGRALGSFVVGKTWVWATSETLHFIGLCLLFGIASLVDLRMLGMMKSVPFSALHRLLPWGVLGFGINLITGMLFFVAAYDQYTTNKVFQWKLALMMLAGLNVLYFTIFDDPWVLGPGDDAPASAKFVAASALVLVFGVIYCGRMLPFLGMAF